MVQVKKATKYSKYFVLLALASVISFIWPNANKSGHIAIQPAIPQAHADVPDPSGPPEDDGDDGDRP